MRSRKVAVYARVSTNQEDQLNALENQKEWYEKEIERHDDWDFVEMYVDEGITGTSIKNRTAFKRMINDAKNGEFELLITREVSRFARNIVDAIQYTRDLKDYGVEVYFINDGIWSFDQMAELKLGLMSTLAQEESRKTSIRVRSGMSVSRVNPDRIWGHGNLLGYDKQPDGSMVVNPEQADTVKRVFDLYLQGKGYRKIKDILEAEGRLTSNGKSLWPPATIKNILSNPIYYGYQRYRRTSDNDFLSKKTFYSRVISEELHPVNITPLISKEDFDKVQEIREGKLKVHKGVTKGYNKPGASKYVFSRLLRCRCGRMMHRSEAGQRRKTCSATYKCSEKLSNKKLMEMPLEERMAHTHSPYISETKLQVMAKLVLKNFKDTVDEVIDMVEKIVCEAIAKEDASTENDTQKEIEALKTQQSRLLDAYLAQVISLDVFQLRNENFEKEIKQLQAKSSDQNTDEEISLAEAMKNISNKLLDYTDFNSDDPIPDQVLEAFFEKIISTGETYDWYLRISDKPVKVKVDRDKIFVIEDNETPVRYETNTCTDCTGKCTTSDVLRDTKFRQIYLKTIPLASPGIIVGIVFVSSLAFYPFVRHDSRCASAVCRLVIGTGY